MRDLKRAVAVPGRLLIQAPIELLGRVGCSGPSLFRVWLCTERSLTARNRCYSRGTEWLVGAFLLKDGPAFVSPFLFGCFVILGYGELHERTRALGQTPGTVATIPSLREKPHKAIPARLFRSFVTLHP